MEVMMLLVYDQPGVMQRVMGEFNRKRINVETIVVGKCEMPERARIVLSIEDREKAASVLEHLCALQEVIEADLVVGEHVDGAVKFDGDHYLIEAKWQERSASNEPVYQFAGKGNGEALRTGTVHLSEWLQSRGYS